MTQPEPSLRDRLLAWERLWIVYNVVMLGFGLPTAVSVYRNVHALPEHLQEKLLFSYSPLCVVGLSVVFGIAANVMYLLGPLAEVYLATLFPLKFGRVARLSLFGLGLLFSLAVMGFVWLTYALIGFDF